MRELFEEHLKHGLSEYDAKYLPTFKYAMLLSTDIGIKAFLPMQIILILLNIQH